jgi:hypothetical protein
VQLVFVLSPQVLETGIHFQMFDQLKEHLDGRH